MPGRGVLGFFPRRWNGLERSPPGRVAVAGFCLRRWDGREPWLAQPGPHFLRRNGGKNPRGKRFFPLDSLLWWVCGGRLYFSLVTWPAALTAKGPWRPAHRLGGLGM